MSSSSANTLRRPARKIACVSATMTRTNWPLPPSSTAPGLSSMLTGMLAMNSLGPLEVIFVDDHAGAASASIFKTAYDASAAIDLHITSRADDFGWQQDREIHHRTDGHIVVHRKQNTVGRNVFGLGGERATLRFHRCGQMQRKSRRTLHLLKMRRVCCFVNHRIFLLFGGHVGFFLLAKNYRQRTPRNRPYKVTEVMER